MAGPNPLLPLDSFRRVDKRGEPAVFIPKAAGFNITGIPVPDYRRSLPNPIQVPQLFTEAFKDLPGLKLAAVDAAISRLSAVLGLRPVRAGLLLVPKVPKPGRLTASPLA